MKKALKIFAVILSIPILLLVYVIGSELFFQSCGLTKEYADERMSKELMERKLDSSNLKFIGSTGTCSHSYDYKDEQGRHFSFSVVSDFLHGPEVHTWDYNRDE